MEYHARLSRGGELILRVVEPIRARHRVEP
jgi:hypothetical protein